ncbi:hypothetical protein EMIHUDRAFT_219878 [Emiliania huxleyi CCMP1516]|uniref:Uncharacterized protein n=2 Tax=Emiliania huxleyi TaxID=2903 RepID=A0A0D3I3F2_EMIH1|nr:hypothetical protein EMIHUDRAFT_219878 [Emiliania huxleyi CCMP1516]EOD05787.1 hypothetical protein EMIHUDRAFT_219878 [Emiliania huxleyi CCMP1516]|eukprot:XP_005758216.1 hypothetical protein EMIHUDRAFT_219878 [Emiliania huxleyi CCMP1516]
MAASRPSIDLDEDIAALLERARVSAPVSGKVVPLLLALDVGNVAALLEAVAEDGLEGLGLGKTVQRQLCRCLPALNSCDAAEAALSSFASLSLAAEGGTGGGAPGAYMDPVAPALPASGDGTIAAAGGEEEVEGVAAAAEAGRRAPETLVVAASDSTYSGADAEEAVAGGGSGAAEASAAATAEEDKRVRALRMALQHKTQMPVTDEEARAILQARGGRETPVTEEEARGGEKLSRRGKKAVAKEAGEVVSREEGEAIYRATLESLLASTGWTPRAAEERAREEQRAHYEGDDAFDALFDGGSGYGWDSPSGGGAFF